MTQKASGTPPRARSRARQAAMQALYQWQLTGQSAADIEAQFFREENMRTTDIEFFQELLHAIPDKLQTLDAQLVPLLDRPIDKVDPVERAILRIGTFELNFRPDIPWRVIINEAVELAKGFGAEQSHKYINGVLDKIARRTRAAEIKASVS